jgi:hypothetical protein
MISRENMYLGRDANICADLQSSTGIKAASLVDNSIFADLKMPAAIEP